MMMSRKVFYMAHPVSQPPGQMRQNLAHAKQCLIWLQEHDREHVYIAPWIPEVEASIKGKINTTYEQALQDDEEVVRHCDGLVLWGMHGITPGMQRELTVMKEEVKGSVIDLTGIPLPNKWNDTAIVKIITQLLQGT